MDFNCYYGTVYIMKKLLFALLLCIVFVSCSKKEEKLPPVAPAYIIENLESMPYYAYTLLPEKLEKYNLVLKEPVQTVRPKELLAKSPKQAEHYLNHYFVGMTSGTYQMKDNSLTAEVLQFADEIKAYGFYASFRPNGIKTEKIGAESFQYGNSRYMLKNDFVVIISVIQVSEEANSVMRSLSIQIENAIIGSNATPPFFLLFPYKSKIIPSNQFFPYQYLNIPALNEVYTTSYLIGSDTLTLFLTMDQTGEKFKYLKQFAHQNGEVVESFNRFKFDSTFSIAFKDSTYGVIVAGIKSHKLIGTIRYNPKVADKYLSTWIKGL